MPSTTALVIRSCPVPLLRHTDLPHPERAVTRGDVVRVATAVYTPAAEWRTMSPWDRYLVRVHAFALGHPDAPLCHESAGVLTGAPVFGDPHTIHVLTPPTGTARSFRGVRTHTSHGERELIEAGGILLTSPAETAVDLARFRHPAIGLAVADAVLRDDRALDTAKLLAINERRLSSRGRARAREVLGKADAAAESAFESVSRSTIHWLGFPEPILQTVFPHGCGEDRGDFDWPQFGIVGEADGDIKYDGSLGDPVEALVRRRERDARLRRHRRTIVHWAWSEVIMYEPLESLLLGAGLPIVAPRQTALLMSMRRLLGPR